MPVYNLIENSSNYFEATGSFWFYSKDEATDFNADIANNNNLKSFEYKTKLLGTIVSQPNSNQANGILRNATIAFPLKYLGNFWTPLEMPLINCKVELKLTWKQCCVLYAAGNDNGNDNDNDDNGKNIIFIIKDKQIVCLCCNFISKRQSKTIKTS